MDLSYLKLLKTLHGASYDLFYFTVTNFMNFLIHPCCPVIDFKSRNKLENKNWSTFFWMKWNFMRILFNPVFGYLRVHLEYTEKYKDEQREKYYFFYRWELPNSRHDYSSGRLPPLSLSRHRSNRPTWTSTGCSSAWARSCWNRTTW